MTGKQVEIDGRPALRFERLLAFPPERVWRAVTEPDELERWFVATVPWVPFEGETFEAAGEPGSVTVVDPPRVLAWTWSTEIYRFELTPVEGGTLLVFEHVFTRSLGPAAQHAAGWEIYFGRLDVHLAGGFISEADAHTAADPGMQERYRAAFEA